MKTLATLVVAASIALSSASALAAPKVLILGTYSSASTEIQSRLQATAAFASVDVVDVSTSTPTLTTLQGYNAVLLYAGWNYFSDGTTLGNNLADYVDGGGGLVVANLALYTGWPIGGRFTSSNYYCIGSSSYSSSSYSLTTSPIDTTSPLVQGVSSFTSSMYQSTGSLNTTWGAVSVWNYTNGTPAICKESINGHPRVDLNFLPYSTYYSGDGATIMKNALLYVAGGGGPFVGKPNPVAFPDTGTGSTASAITVTFTNTTTSSATANSYTLAGTNPGDFAVTGPQTPIVVPAGATFTVNVTFSPKATGARTATLKVAVANQTTTNDVALTGNGIGPKLTVTPSPLKLGTTGVGVSVSKDVTVTNSGGTVTVTGAQITVDGAEFALGAGPAYGVVLPTGGSFNQTIKFTPQSTGVRNGTLTFTTDDPNNPTINVPLVGTSGPPMITLDAGTVVFPATNVGATSSPQTIHVTNSGYSDLVVSALTVGGTNPNDIKATSTALPGTVAPGSTVGIDVTFTPTAAGTRSATLTIASNDPNTPSKVVNFSGTATQAVASVSPTSLAFGNNAVNVASTAQSVTVSNTGTGTLNVLSITFDGQNGGSYQKTSGPTPPFAISSGASSPFNVVCDPKMIGALNATLTVHTDVGDKAVALTCTGTAPMISVSPTSLDFGDVAVKVASAPQAITVTNSGTQTLAVSAVSIAGANASDFSSTDAPQSATMLDPGKSFTFHVAFTPSVQGSETAEVDIASNDPQMPLVKVPLTGTGAQLQMSFTPTAGLDFGMVSVGAISAPKAATITNTGGAPIQVSTVSLSGTGMAYFSADATGGFTLMPGESKDVNVTFHPTMGGTQQASLSVLANGLVPATIPLRGVGVNPSIAAAPNALDFGPIVVGNSSVPQTVSLKNGGGSPLTISGINSASPAFTVDTSQTTMTLMPGETTTFAVTFAPTAAGAATSQVSVSLMGLSVPAVQVAVSGTGVQAQNQGGGCAVGGTRPAGGGEGAALFAVAVLAIVIRRRRGR